MGKIVASGGFSRSHRVNRRVYGLIVREKDGAPAELAERLISALRTRQ